MSNGLTESSVPTVEAGTNGLLAIAAEFEGVVIDVWLLPGESPPTPDSDDVAGSFAFSAAAAKLFVGERDDDAEDEEPADHDLIVRQCNTGRTSRQN